MNKQSLVCNLWALWTAFAYLISEFTKAASVVFASRLQSIATSAEDLAEFKMHQGRKIKTA